LIDALASEYGWPPQIIRQLPLAQVLCYHAAILERREITSGPSFAERDLLATLNL
jgi:hypothetical protein